SAAHPAASLRKQYSQALAQAGQDLMSDALDQIRRGMGWLKDEIPHSLLAVPTHEIRECVERPPRILIRRYARHIEDRFDDRTGITPGHDQSRVEPLTSLRHLLRRAHRVPAIDVRRDQTQHLRARRGEGQWRPRLLDRYRAGCRAVQLVMGSRKAADLVPEQDVQHLYRLAEPVDSLGIVRVLDPEHRVLELDPAGAEPDLEPAAADVVD